jgi:hypothetical protein
MHRAETDRNITPTTQQMPGKSLSARAASAAAGGGPGSSEVDDETAEIEAAASPTERIIPAGADSVVIGNRAMGIGGRWDVFQSRLRERRKEAVAGCKTCTSGSATDGSVTDRGADGADTLRKAV